MCSVLIRKKKPEKGAPFITVIRAEFHLVWRPEPFPERQQRLEISHLNGTRPLISLVRNTCVKPAFTRQIVFWGL